MEPIIRSYQIAAAPRLCYDAVTNYEDYPRFFPEFKEVSVLDREGTAQIVEFTANYGKLVSYTLRIDHDEAALRTSWTYVGGDLKNSEGGWTFKDDGKKGTAIEYRVLVEVGFLVPKMISDGLISRNIPAMFDQLTKEVARRKGSA